MKSTSPRHRLPAGPCRWYASTWTIGGEGANAVVGWNGSGPLSGSHANATWNAFHSVSDPSGLGGRSTLTPSVTGAVGEALTLRDLFLTRNTFYLAMDHLRFAQVLEPATNAALTGAAALVLVVVLRRSRS